MRQKLSPALAAAQLLVRQNGVSAAFVLKREKDGQKHKLQSVIRSVRGSFIIFSHMNFYEFLTKENGVVSHLSRSTRVLCNSDAPPSSIRSNSALIRTADKDMIHFTKKFSWRKHFFHSFSLQEWHVISN